MRRLNYRIKLLSSTFHYKLYTKSCENALYRLGLVWSNSSCKSMQERACLQAVAKAKPVKCHIVSSVNNKAPGKPNAQWEFLVMQGVASHSLNVILDPENLVIS